MTNKRVHDLCYEICKNEFPDEIDFFEFHWQVYETKEEIQGTSKTSFIDSLQDVGIQILEWSIPFLLSRIIKIIVKISRITIKNKSLNKKEVRKIVETDLKEAKEKISDDTIDKLTEWITDEIL